MKTLKAVLISLIAALGLSLVLDVPGSAANEYYQGKRMRMLVPYSAGGGYDLYARIIARHWSRHIPGNPSFIVQNMPGGAGVIAGNYLYRAARRDGLTVSIMNRESPSQEVSKLAGVEFKTADFSWIGNANVEMTAALVRADTGIKSLKDVINRPKPVIVGSTGAGAVNYNLPAVLNEVLKTNFKIITGYGGTSDIRAAMERGEVDGIAGWSWSSVITTGAHLLEKKTVNVLVYYAPEKNKEMTERGVPWIFDFPMSKQDRTYIDTVFFSNAVGRPFAAPPGTSPELLGILRSSFMKTVQDPAFLREADKLGLEVVDPFGGEKVEKMVRDFLATDPKVLERVARLLSGKS
jgi:tripartite-type tricarboxylate transporter receptor subunit TctC